MLQIYILDDLHNDVVDRDVDQLNKKSNETHDRESDCSRNCDLLKLFSIRFRAAFHQSN